MEFFLKALIVSFIQGVTEWVPVSSSAQIIFSSTLLGLTSSQIFSLIVFGHLGTVFSSIVFFRNELSSILKSFKGIDNESKGLLKFLIVSTFFSGLIGLPLYLLLRFYFLSFNSEYISLLAGLLLIINGFLKREVVGGEKKFSTPQTTDAVLSGLVQGLSVLPGISRSGITIFSLLMLGYYRKNALTLSFLMAIPAVLGFVLFNFALDTYTFFPFPMIVLVTAASFLTGLATIKYFLSFSEKIDFAAFCWVIGLLMSLSSLYIMFTA